jgi:hypothetical protein
MEWPMFISVFDEDAHLFWSTFVNSQVLVLAHGPKIGHFLLRLGWQLAGALGTKSQIRVQPFTKGKVP